ncbi:MAG: hypothetical protein AABO41_05070 [Acidobacteriota bacterium]
MRRIRAGAKSIGASWYQGRRIEPWDKNLALERNKAWILKKIKQGYEIVDIGIDATRSFRSPFYEMEKKTLREQKYPAIPYARISRGKGS